MTLTLQKIAEAAEKMNFVETATVWKERRVYVNLVGANRSFAGDRNLKAYYDGRRWVFDGYKGTMSRDFADSFEAFRAEYSPVRV